MINDVRHLRKPIERVGTVKFLKLANFRIIQSGADLSGLVRESSEFALKEFIKNPCSQNEFVKRSHFEQAFLKIKPSVSLKVSVFDLDRIIHRLNAFPSIHRIVSNMKR
jgi:SpoVK/Ycf46/Vps4 family AAA+-type ATPase